MRARGFSRLVAAALFPPCKLLIVNGAILSAIKMKPPYSGSHSESVSSHMEIFMHKSKLVKLYVCERVKQCHSWVLELGFEKTAGQYFVISKFFPPRYQGKKSQKQSYSVHNSNASPTVRFSPIFPRGLEFSQLCNSQRKKCRGE